VYHTALRGLVIIDSKKIKEDSQKNSDKVSKIITYFVAAKVLPFTSTQIQANPKQLYFFNK
jgi:hypothetical protein